MGFSGRGRCHALPSWPRGGRKGRGPPAGRDSSLHPIAFGWCLIVVKDELAAGTLVEVFTIPGLTEEFHAITQRRRFPNPLLGELLEG